MENHILIVTDADELFEQVKSALLGDNIQILRVRSGPDALDIIKGKNSKGKNSAETNSAETNIHGSRMPVPDLVVSDLQVGAMGGIAISYDIHLEAKAKRIPNIAILLLLDREADIFLAKDAEVDAYMVKPVNALKLGAMVRDLLAKKSRVETQRAINIMGD